MLGPLVDMWFLREFMGADRHRHTYVHAYTRAYYNIVLTGGQIGVVCVVMYCRQDCTS